MSKSLRISIALGLAAATAAAAATEARELAFVSCPIMRDTRQVPCWLAEYDGELYYLGIQTDVSAPFMPPSLGHKVLVEGKANPDRPRICGGIVIEPVVLSVLPEIDDSCRTILPSDDRYQLPFTAPRPPGPSAGRLAFDSGRPPRMEMPQPPYKVQSFTVKYDFDGTVTFMSPRQVQPIYNYADRSEAKRIEITGYRAAVKLSDGTVLAEAENIAKRRAQEMEHLLRGAGLTKAKYEVRWKDEPEIGGPEKRRVEVVVHPR
jgi:acylphosphatase